jgi:hypothetical protein
MVHDAWSVGHAWHCVTHDAWCALQSPVSTVHLDEIIIPHNSCITHQVHAAQDLERAVDASRLQ